MNCYAALASIMFLAALAIYAIVQIWSLFRRLTGSAEDSRPRAPVFEIFPEEIELAKLENRKPDTDELADFLTEGIQRRKAEQRVQQAKLIDTPASLKKVVATMMLPAPR